MTAYWLTSARMASHAAAFIGSGAGKSGKPWARLTPPSSAQTRDISRMTDSVNCRDLAETECGRVGDMTRA